MISPKIRGMAKSILAMLNLSVRRRHFLSDDYLQINALLSLFEIGTVIDIGANKGQFAKQILGDKTYRGRVISFEAEERSHRILEQEAAKNQRWFVGPKCALGSSQGEAQLHVSKNSVSSSLLNVTQKHIESAPGSESNDTQTIEIHTLDRLLASSDDHIEPYFVKIDVQGFELEVIKGAIDTLKKCPAIIMETSLFELYRGQPSWLEVIDFMDRIGFFVWGVQKGFHDKLTGQQLQLDTIFVSREFYVEPKLRSSDSF